MTRIRSWPAIATMLTIAGGCAEPREWRKGPIPSVGASGPDEVRFANRSYRRLGGADLNRVVTGASFAYPDNPDPRAITITGRRCDIFGWGGEYVRCGDLAPRMPGRYSVMADTICVSIDPVGAYPPDCFQIYRSRGGLHLLRRLRPGPAALEPVCVAPRGEAVRPCLRP